MAEPTSAEDQRHLELAEEIYRHLRRYTPRILDEAGIDGQIARSVLSEIAIHCAVRLLPTQRHQKSGIGPTKYIGYIVFWFQKLQPISQAVRRDGERRVITDINERVAVRLGLMLLSRVDISKVSKKLADSAAKHVKTKDAAQERIFHFANWLFGASRYYEYLIYTLRFRRSSPHFIIMVLNSIIAGAFYEFAPANKARRLGGA